MTEEKRNDSGGIRRLLCIVTIALVGICWSCSPKIVEKIVVQRDTTIVHHRDSIIRRDSVWMKEYVKGDTVFVEKYKDRYVFRDRWRDSISVKEVHDTTTVEKKVEKELTAGQKTKIGAFWWLVAGLVAALVWIFRKPILALIKKLTVG